MKLSIRGDFETRVDVAESFAGRTDDVAVWRFAHPLAMHRHTIAIRTAFGWIHPSGWSLMSIG